MNKTSANLERFWKKVDQSGDCWTWTAGVFVGRPEDGGLNYGAFWADNRAHRAHRWIYGQVVEPLILGSAIDHLCRNTLCVRPDHLEQVTHQVNVLRGVAPAAKNAAMTRCKRDHDLTPENTMLRAGGKRRCRICYADEQARYNASRRAAALYR